MNGVREPKCPSCMVNLDNDGKVFTRKDSRPRPISLEEWGDMGLVVTEKALSSIWVEDGEDFVFDIKVSVEKV